MSERLRLEIRDDRGHARLTPPLVERLLARLQGDRLSTLVTLEGAVDSFCEGMDLGELVNAEGDVAVTLGRFGALLRAIASAPKPVVALVGGAAMGGGVGLAAAADLVLATPQATFGLPETVFGLVPSMVFPVIARRVGPARARWLALGAPTITAADAWRLGLVDEVVDDLEAALARHARRLGHLDPRAVAEVKAMSALYETDVGAYHARATTSFALLLASADTRDRIDRFLAGESPWTERGGS